MNFRKIHASKILAAAVTGAFALSAMSVTASAVSIGSASIFLADETWSSQVYWGNGTEGKDTIGIASVSPAEITGDGTYTTSVEFEKAMDYGCFFCLNSDIKGTGSGSFADYPDAEMSITSVKADGKEISGNTSISDINDDGYMKINIFDPLTDADGNYADSLEWTSGIKSMEVTFTVTGTGILSAEAPEEDDAAENQPDDGSSTPADEGTEAEGTTENDSASEDDGTVGEDNSPADEPVSGEAEESVPADDNTEAPDTGNISVSALALLMAVSGAAAVSAKKSK